MIFLPLLGQLSSFPHWSRVRIIPMSYKFPSPSRLVLFSAFFTSSWESVPPTREEIPAPFFMRFLYGPFAPYILTNGKNVLMSRPQFGLSYFPLLAAISSLLCLPANGFCLFVLRCFELLLFPFAVFFLVGLPIIALFHLGGGPLPGNPSPSLVGREVTFFPSLDDLNIFFVLPRVFPVVLFHVVLILASLLTFHRATVVKRIFFVVTLLPSPAIPSHLYSDFLLYTFSSN